VTSNRVQRGVHKRDQQSTVASASNRDQCGRPMPKLPKTPEEPRKSAHRLAWDRVLSRVRRHPVTVSISSLARYHRLRLPETAVTAARERVSQFRGQGLGIQVIGLAAWGGLSWLYDFRGALGGAGVALACYAIGRSRLKPWRCGNCKAPLATAQVRVCPGCHARLVGTVAQ